MNQLRNIHLSDLTYHRLEIHLIKALKMLILLLHPHFNQLPQHLYHLLPIPYLYFLLNNQFRFIQYHFKYQLAAIPYLTAIELMI